MQTITQNQVRNMNPANLAVTVHAELQIRKRGITGESIVKAAKSGTLAPGKKTSWGTDTITATLDTGLRVVFAYDHQRRLALISAYYYEGVTGIPGGYNPEMCN